MPPLDDFSFAVNHFLPVSLLILARIVAPHGEPANDLLPSHLLDIYNGEHETDAGQFKLNDLEDESFVELWVVHTATNGSFTLGQLLADGVEHCHLYVRI